MDAPCPPAVRRLPTSAGTSRARMQYPGGWTNPLGYVPPAEYEGLFYREQAAQADLVART